MNRFIKVIIMFVLPIIICMYPLDYLISKYLSKSQYYASGEILVWNDIYNGTINADLLVYGSSRAWIQINPIILEEKLGVSTYNLGIDGHNFWLEYLRHLEYMKNNKKPKTILFSLDAFTLQKRADLFNYKQFLPYLLWNSNVEQYTSSYIGYSIFDYYIPLVRYFGVEGSFVAAVHGFLDFQNTLPVRVKGHRGIDKTWNDDLEKAKSKTEFLEIVIDSATVVLFEQFLNECKKDEIEIIFVFTPEYIEGKKFFKNRDELMKMYYTFANRYNIEFLDYSDDEMNLDTRYFYNSAHLNKEGSILFTKKLAIDLQKLHSKSLNKH